jgi:hypothetical protein
MIHSDFFQTIHFQYQSAGIECFDKKWHFQIGVKSGISGNEIKFVFVLIL